MTTNAELITRIDWDEILPMSRCAGRHDEQMQGLIKNSKVLAHWNEGNYQGRVATVIRLKDTKEIVMYSDYYGSCSGCDAWDGADDDEVRSICTGLIGTAKIFSTLREAKAFLKSGRKKGDDYDFVDDVRANLLKELGL